MSQAVDARVPIHTARNWAWPRVRSSQLMGAVSCPARRPDFDAEVALVRGNSDRKYHVHAATVDTLRPPGGNACKHPDDPRARDFRLSLKYRERFTVRSWATAAM